MSIALLEVDRTNWKQRRRRGREGKIMNRKSDSELRSEVSQELKWDSRVGLARPDVDVSDGVVALTGIVTSYSKKLAAQKAAHRVAGVLDVANDIKVRPEGIFERSDTDIAH